MLVSFSTDSGLLRSLLDYSRHQIQMQLDKNMSSLDVSFRSLFGSINSKKFSAITMCTNKVMTVPGVYLSFE